MQTSHKHSPPFLTKLLGGWIHLACLALGYSLALQGCAPLFVGGVITSATVVADRRTTGAQLTDETLEIKAGRAIEIAVKKEYGDVSVLSYNRHILLTGQVANTEYKALASQIAESFLDVTKVSNQLNISPNVSALQKSADTLLTAKVKSTLIAASNIPFKAIKVTTQLGIVYFMGLLTQTEADQTAHTIRSISGVQKVVNLAQIITPEQLEAIQPPAPQEQSENEKVTTNINQNN